MNYKYRYTLNNTVLEDEPAQWDELEHEIVRNIEKRFVLTRHLGRLKFIGDGYDLLLNEINTNGYCGMLPLVIERRTDEANGWQTEIEGAIFLSQCVFNDRTKTVLAPVQDNSFEARVNNNRKIEALITETETKNGQSLTAATSTSVSISGLSYQMYDVKEVFRYLVEFMTDNEVQFASDWYDNIPDGEGLAIVRGEELRTRSGLAPSISYEALFEAVSKIHNLYQVVDNQSTPATIRLEDENYFFDSTPLLTIERISEMERSILEEIFYSRVKVGSTNTSTGSRPSRVLITPEVEEYNLDGTCNLDAELNLTFNLITDTNIISAILAGDDSHDDDPVLINYDKSTNQIIVTNVLGGNMYNRFLWNDRIMSRYNLGNNIVKYLGGNVGTFEATNPASRTNPTGTIDPYDFKTEVSDPGNNYDPTAGNYDYTAPAEGVYTFKVIFAFEILTAPLSDYFKAFISVFDSGGSHLQDYPYSNSSGEWLARETVLDRNMNIVSPMRYVTYSTYLSPLANANNNHGLTEGFLEVEFPNIYMEAGQYCRLKTDTLNPSVGIGGSYRFNSGSDFSCVTSYNAGGIFGSGDSQLYRSSLLDFEINLSDDQIGSLNTYPHQAFKVQGISNKPVLVWNYATSINRITRKATIKAITNLDSI